MKRTPIILCSVQLLVCLVFLIVNYRSKDVVMTLFNLDLGLWVFLYLNLYVKSHDYRY